MGTYWIWLGKLRYAFSLMSLAAVISSCDEAHCQRGLSLRALLKSVM